MARHIAIIEPARNTRTCTVYAVTTISTIALAADSGRKKITLQNNSDTAIHFRTDGGTASTSDGKSLVLAASGGSWSEDINIPMGAITAIHGGVGTKNLTIEYA